MLYLRVAAGMLVTLTGLAGCAPAPPEAPHLPFEPPAAWKGAAPLEEALPDVGGEWWRQFGDGRLDALVDEALENSPTVGAAAARLDGAAAQARIAGADGRPRVDLSLEGNRRRQNFIGLPIPGAEGEVLSNLSSTRAFSVDVAWEADLWGRLRAGSAAALATAGAAEADLVAVRNSLIGQVVKAWLGWVEAGEQLALATRTLENRSRFREQIESRYRYGLRTALDLRLAMTSEADSEASRSARAQAAAEAARRLEALVARYPSGDTLPAVDGGLPATPPRAAAGQPAALLTRRPDLIAAELAMAARGLDVEAARAALYPRLRLSGSVGRSSDRLEDLIDDDFSVWSLAAGLLQPVFQGGRLRAAVSAAEARRAEAAALYLGAVLRAFGEVESALSAESHLDERIAALKGAVEQSTAAERLAEERYRAGLDDYLTVLESQRQATVSRSLLLAARRSRLEARVDLHLALGGDFAAHDSGKASP